MSNSFLEKIVKTKDYIFKVQLFNIVREFNLSINELLLLVFFINQINPTLDVNLISDITKLDEKNILEAFTLLNSKGLIKIDMQKTDDGKMLEVINLENIYKAMVSNLNNDYQDKTKTSIFETFEKEFGRTLSPMEYELISAWIKSGISEELIIGALKEATYNGVNNLRYIDKIIYEWGKKGFKNMKDVNEYLEKRNKQKNDDSNEVLFDYNWLEDE